MRTEEGSLALEVEDESGEDHVVEANRGRLLSILENLFRNEIEHGGQGVTVTVGTRSGGFYVADDGPGVPDGVGNVFDLRLHHERRRQRAGTVELETGDDGAAGARFVFDLTDATVIPDREVGRRATI